MSIRPAMSMRVDGSPQVVAWRAAEARRTAQQRHQPGRRRGQASVISNQKAAYRIPRGGREEVADGQEG